MLVAENFIIRLTMTSQEISKFISKNLVASRYVYNLYLLNVVQFRTNEERDEIRRVAEKKCGLKFIEEYQGELYFDPNTQS